MKCTRHRIEAARNVANAVSSFRLFGLITDFFNELAHKLKNMTITNVMSGGEAKWKTMKTEATDT